MIARADSPAGRRRFRRACRAAPCVETFLPLEYALFGRSQPGRFYAGPSLALDVGGREAFAAGGANPEELAAFLHFCGCASLVTNGTAPAGWHKAEPLYCFGMEAGQALAVPAADERLWASLALDTKPSPGLLADFLYPGQPSRRDDFYSALCTKRSRGLAQVWLLSRGGVPVCTMGAYAIWHGEAYIACGCTAEGLRGRGVGGRLIVQLANSLAAKSLRIRFLCSPARRAFYQRLGFAPVGALSRYIDQ